MGKLNAIPALGNPISKRGVLQAIGGTSGDIVDTVSGSADAGTINAILAVLRDKGFIGPGNLGPELVADGGFDTGTPWALANGNGSATIVGSELVLSGDGTAFPNAGQAGILVSGTTYHVTVVSTAALASGALGVRIGGATANFPDITAAGTYEADIVADGTDILLIRNSTFTDTAHIASISVREPI